MKAYQLKASIIKTGSVIVDYVAVIRNPKGGHFSTRVVVVAESSKGYRAGYKNKENGKIEMVKKFSNLKDLKAAL